MKNLLRDNFIVLSVIILVLSITFVSAEEPKLVKVTDSLGNTQANSWAKGNGGDWKSELRTNPTTELFCSNCTIKIGDTVKFTITANQDNVLYMCSAENQGILKDWSASNICEWTAKRGDYGPDATVTIAIKNDNGLNWEDIGDDYTYMIYRVNGDSNNYSSPDYSNCKIKIENYNPNTQECALANITDCSGGSYRIALCPEGLKVIERLGPSVGDTTSIYDSEISCNITLINGTTIIQDSEPKKMNKIYNWFCEQQEIDANTKAPYIKRWGNTGNLSECESDHIKRGIWITNDSICNDSQRTNINEQIANLSQQVNKTNSEVIALTNKVQEQQSTLDKILNFLKRLFRFNF